MKEGTRRRERRKHSEVISMLRLSWQNRNFILQSSFLIECAFYKEVISLPGKEIRIVQSPFSLDHSSTAFQL